MDAGLHTAANFSAFFDGSRMRDLARAGAVRPEESDPLIANRQHHVLVVDDDMILREIISRHLTKQGYRVTLAVDGAQALVEIENTAPDLIVLDHYLPDTTGADLLAALRQHKEGFAIPVIYLTGDDTHQRFRESMNSGADDFFTKPVAIPELLQAVKAQLRKSHTRMIAQGDFPQSSSEKEIACLALQLHEVEARLKSVCADRQRIQQALQSLESGMAAWVSDEHRKLERENSALKAYGYALAHELRRPLRGIVGYAGLLKESEAGKLGNEASRMLVRIEKSGRSMNEFIEGLLAMATAEHSKFRRMRVDLSAMALEAVESCAPPDALPPTCVRIASGLATHADPVLMRIVLENLLSNAFKYTSTIALPNIEFDTCELNCESVFFVRDNGIGFNMADAVRMFEPFHRLHSTNDYEGLGIGLATVQQIIERHGGRIWARSAVGEGTTFFFTLGEAACSSQSLVT